MLASSRNALIGLVVTVFIVIMIWSNSSGGGEIDNESVPISIPSRITNQNERDVETTRDVDGNIIAKSPSNNNNKQQEHEGESKNSKKKSSTISSNDINEDPKLWNNEQVSTSSSQTKKDSSYPSPKQVFKIRQCRPLGKKFAKAVSDWLKDSSSSNSDEKNNQKNPIKRLIYSCESHKRGLLCGGMGDRFRGMVSSAFLALLSKRRFELFHPVPVPLQEYLQPKFIPWVPTVRSSSSQENQKQQQKTSSSSSSSSSILKSAKSYRELDSHMQKIPNNRLLMRLSSSKKIVPFLQPSSNNEVLDLRIQSNTAGIDKYLLRDPTLKNRWQNELGLPLSCNLTCYFGCMYALLFEPSKSLEKEMNRVLKNFSVDDDDVVHHQEKQVKIPLSKAVVEVHRNQRPLLPLVGLQIRVGGNWASGFRVGEPFRTVPAAFPFVFQHVKTCQCGLTSSSSSSVEKILQNGKVSTENCDDSYNNKNKLPIFVTSDSERFVKLTRETFSTKKNKKSSEEGEEEVFFINEDSYQHTDTVNVHHAIPEKFRRIQVSEKIFAVYRMTLINHVVLAACSSLVFGQSGFADSAFWAARNSDLDNNPQLVSKNNLILRPTGIGIFMDMTNNKIAWEHTASFPDKKIVVLKKDSDVDVDEDGDENIDFVPAPMVAVKNRIADVVNQKDLVLKKPFFLS